MALHRTRRGILVLSSASLSLTLSGCHGDEPLADVSIFNETPTPQRGTITVVRKADGTAVLDDQFGLDSTDRNPRRYENPITRAGPHEVTIRIDNQGQERYSWNVPAGSKSDDQDENYALVVSIRAEEIGFDQVTDYSD